MAKKIPTSKRSTGADRHTKPRLAFHLDQELLDAVNDHVASLQPSPSVSAVLVLAVKEYLTTRGAWTEKKRPEKS